MGPDSLTSISNIRLYHFPLYHFPLYQIQVLCYINFCYICFCYSNFHFLVISQSVISDSVIAMSIISKSIIADSVISLSVISKSLHPVRIPPSGMGIKQVTTSNISLIASPPRQPLASLCRHACSFLDAHKHFIFESDPPIELVG